MAAYYILYRSKERLALSTATDFARSLAEGKVIAYMIQWDYAKRDNWVTLEVYADGGVRAI